MASGEYERTMVELITYGIAAHALRREEAAEVAEAASLDPIVQRHEGSLTARQLLDAYDRMAHAWLLAHPDREPLR